LRIYDGFKFKEQDQKIIDNYMAFRSGHSDKTVITNISGIRIFMRFHKNKTFDEISLEDVIEFYRKHESSENTKIQYLSRLTLFYNWGISENYFLRNPVEKFLVTLRKSKKEREYLTKEQTNYLLSNVFEYEYRLFLMFFLHTGVRNSEFRNLKIHDVDMDERTIRILGKGRKERYVFIDNELYSYLKIWLIQRDSKFPKSDHFFVNRLGNPIRLTHLVSFTDYLNEVSKNKIGFRITPHILRHTFATRCIDMGMDLKTLSLILGHEDIKTTSIYLHKNKESLKREFLRVMN